MNKTEFLQALRKELSGLPSEDIEKSVEFYNEIVSDAIEEGKSEEEAVAALGEIESIRLHILEEMPMSKLLKTKLKLKRALHGWEIVLIVLGFPLWLPLLGAALTLAVTAYGLLWVGVGLLYVADLTCAVLGVAGVVGAVLQICLGNFSSVLLVFGVGLLGGGLSIFLFFISNKAAKMVLKFTQKLWLGIKYKIVQKEVTQ